MQVVEFCRSALVQCELIQHPVAPPTLSHTIDHHGNTSLRSTELAGIYNSVAIHVSSSVQSTNATPDSTSPPPTVPIDNDVAMETQYNTSPQVLTAHSPIVRINEPISTGSSLHISSGVAREMTKLSPATYGLDDKHAAPQDTVGIKEDNPVINLKASKEDNPVINPKASKEDNPVINPKASKEDNPVINPKASKDTPCAMSFGSNDIDSDTEEALQLFVAASPDTSDLEVEV